MRWAGTRHLQFSVVSAGPRISWLRVDGQTIWYPARPADETAPTTGSVIISITSGPTRTVIDPAVVHRLATEFNRLLRTTPGKSSGVACFEQRTERFSISFGPARILADDHCVAGGLLPLVGDPRAEW